MNAHKLNPGATVGVLGGGQLGRYFALIARQYGYHVWVLDPDPDAPAMQIASRKVVARYDDETALQEMGQACDAITIEFENVPAQSLKQLALLTQLAPAADTVEIAQNRLQEKLHARRCDLHPVPHAAINNVEQINAAAQATGLPAILKTATLGYDGKGQQVCHSIDDVTQAFEAFGGIDCVLEKKLDLAAELSVIVVRAFDGEIAVFPVSQNSHNDGILFSSIVPADISPVIQEKAIIQSKTLVESINHVGVLAIEYFIDSDDNLYFNEMAPRPHNSGHYTLDATVCSQFEQQLRVLCGQPLGSTDQLSPVVMINLLGDLWPAGESPDFGPLLATKGCQLHLYGKTQARPGRKMGHFNCLASNCKDALASAVNQFNTLKQQV
jgi:5-(carboxyamino)imidazole ribonucleotide synthase